jgi:hypothetical protein
MRSDAPKASSAATGTVLENEALESESHRGSRWRVRGQTGHFSRLGMCIAGWFPCRAQHLQRLGAPDFLT